MTYLFRGLAILSYLTASYNLSLGAVTDGPQGGQGDDQILGFFIFTMIFAVTATKSIPKIKKGIVGYILKFVIIILCVISTFPVVRVASTFIHPYFCTNAFRDSIDSEHLLAAYPCNCWEEDRSYELSKTCDMN